jgi:peroxiredoxin
MKTPLFLITIILLALTNCKYEESFKLIGELKTDFEGLIYLEYDDNIDSFYVKSKHFEFKGNVEYPTYAYIYSPSLDGESVIIENKTQNISLKEYNHSLTIENYSGQTLNGIINEFKIFTDSLQNDPNFDLYLFEKLKQRFSENPKSQVNGLLLSFFPISNNLSTENILNLYNMIDINTQIPSDMEMLKTTIEKRKKFAIGEHIENFKIPDLNDNEVFISDYQSKVLLIEFWASWCGGCLEKNNHLKELYNKYNEFGFDILGISVDENEGDMMKIINRENFKWDNYRVNFGHPFINELGILLLPSNFLIDFSGTILATDINTSGIEEILKNKLKN